MLGETYGSVEQKGHAGPLSGNSACAFLTPAAPHSDQGATGEVRTALHLQFAGLLVQREFLQIQGTGCCCGESAKENKKEGKNDSSLLLRILQGGKARGRWRIDPCV